MSNSEASIEKKTASAPARSHADAIEALALKFSVSRETEASSEWDAQSVQSCLVDLKTALRQRSEKKLEAVVETYGGLPPQWRKWPASEPLGDAAKDPGAFGFEFLLDIQQAEWELKARQSGHVEKLGDWLRAGMINNPWRAKTWNGAKELASGQEARPVAVCLAYDNPMALAQIMKNQGRFDALVSSEPTPSKSLPGTQGLVSKYDPKFRDEARKAGAVFETSLLWHAVSLRAYRCAAMLAAMPDFSRTLNQPRSFGSGLEDSHWVDRQTQDVFHESDACVEFSFFEWMMSNANCENFWERDRAQAGWQAMIQSSAEHAGSEVLNWRQEGTGLGWAEIYFAHVAPQKWGHSVSHNEVAQRAVADAINFMAILEKAGFAINWGLLSKVSEGCAPLRDWIELREASIKSVVDNGVCNGASRKSPSL